MKQVRPQISIKKANKTELKRYKILLYGRSGCGKTMTSLMFPKPLIFDLENGSIYYDNKINFDRVDNIKTAQDVINGVAYLCQKPQGYNTLVVDSISELWDMLQRDYLQQCSIKYKKEDYALTHSDWGKLKNDWRGLLNMLNGSNSVDMNVICIAKEKAIYASEQQTSIVGYKPSGEKDMEYVFDIVLRMRLDNKERTFIVEKDRTSILETGNVLTLKELLSKLDIEVLTALPKSIIPDIEIEEDYSLQKEIIVNELQKLIDDGSISYEKMREYLKTVPIEGIGTVSDFLENMKNGKEELLAIIKEALSRKKQVQHVV